MALSSGSPGICRNFSGMTNGEIFLKVIEKAKESCETSGNTVPDHFVEANKMVSLGIKH